MDPFRASIEDVPVDVCTEFPVSMEKSHEKRESIPNKDDGRSCNLMDNQAVATSSCMMAEMSPSLPEDDGQQGRSQATGKLAEHNVEQPYHAQFDQAVDRSPANDLEYGYAGEFVDWQQDVGHGQSNAMNSDLIAADGDGISDPTWDWFYEDYAPPIVSDQTRMPASPLNTFDSGCVIVDEDQHGLLSSHLGDHRLDQTMIDVGGYDQGYRCNTAISPGHHPTADIALGHHMDHPMEVGAQAFATKVATPLTPAVDATTMCPKHLASRAADQGYRSNVEAPPPLAIDVLAQREPTGSRSQTQRASGINSPRMLVDPRKIGPNEHDILALHTQNVMTATGPVYRCTNCSQVFKDARLCIRHWRCVHHGKRPYSCSWCRTAFKRKDHAKRHLKTCPRWRTIHHASNTLLAREV